MQTEPITMSEGWMWTGKGKLFFSLSNFFPWLHYILTTAFSTLNSTRPLGRDEAA